MEKTIDSWELTRILDNLIGRAVTAMDPIADGWAEGDTLWIETRSGQRFRLDVTMEGRVGEP